MIFSLDQITELIVLWKYFFVFIAAIIEGPIATVISGFLSSQGIMNAAAVYFCVVLGDLTADSLYYALGRWGKRGAINKWGKYIGLSMKKITAMESHFAKHGGKTVVTGKLAHGIGIVILAAAGASQMPYKKFLLFSLIGVFPQSLILLLIGYYFGHAYNRIGSYLDYYAILVVVVVIILIGVYFLIRRYSRKIEKKL